MICDDCAVFNFKCKALGESIQGAPPLILKRLGFGRINLYTITFRVNIQLKLFKCV